MDDQSVCSIAASLGGKNSKETVTGCMNGLSISDL
jgi:hypothetical protein